MRPLKSTLRVLPRLLLLLILIICFQNCSGKFQARPEMFQNLVNQIPAPSSHSFTFSCPITFALSSSPIPSSGTFFGNSRCAGSGLPVCLDFESGVAPWPVVDGSIEISTDQHARGTSAWHITGGSRKYLYRGTLPPALPRAPITHTMGGSSSTLIP